MLVQILNLAWKELLQLRRDRFLLLFLIIAPTLQLVLLSRNTARGIRDLPMAVLDLDQSALSREFVSMLANTEELAVSSYPSDAESMRALLDGGEAEIGLLIPAGFSQAFFASNPRPAQVLAWIDGTNVLVGSNAGQVLESVANILAARYFAPAIAIDLGGVRVQTSALFNPSFNYQWHAIPSMVAFITYQVTLVVAATAFVRERELGTLEQILITPLRQQELILGKTLPSALIGMFNFLLLMAVQILGYGVPQRGDPGLLLGAALLFVLAIVAQGMVISVFSRTQQQAVLLVFLVAILEVTISGYLLPVEDMPLAMRGLAQVSALQHFMSTMRALVLRGASFAMVRGHLLAIVAFAIVAQTVAWRAFRRSIL